MTGLMIWEEGQKVDPAPREIEQKVKEEYKNSQELDWETIRLSYNPRAIK